MKRGWLPFQNAGKCVCGSLSFQNFLGENAPGSRLEVRPPPLALWDTCLHVFSLKCPSTLRINESPVVGCASSYLLQMHLDIWAGVGGGHPQTSGSLVFWAAREIWAKPIFKEVCMCVCVCVPVVVVVWLLK